MSRESIRRVIRTYLATVIGLWIPGLLGWINAVTEWARAEGATPFPDASGLMYLAVAAITAAFPAAVQLIWNSSEDAAGKAFLRTVPPANSRGQGGWLDPRLAGAVLVTAVVVILLIALL